MKTKMKMIIIRKTKMTTIGIPEKAPFPTVSPWAEPGMPKSNARKLISKETSKRFKMNF